MSQFDAPQFDAAQTHALLEHMASGQPLGPLLGQTVQSQETLYYLAHTFYSQGKYAEAMRMFGFLMLFDHLDRRYYAGLAACLQMQRRWRDAIRYWQTASTLDLTDPVPVIHAAECHMNVGERAQARDALTYALEQSTVHDAHRQHLPRVEALLKLLDIEKSPNPAGVAPEPIQQP